MFDPTHLENILHANNIDGSSSESDIRNLLKNLKWPDGDINDSIKHLEKKGWFIVKNPFEDSAFASDSLLFRVREYLKYLNTKLFKKRVYVDDPLKKPPVFNTFTIHQKRSSPFTEKPKVELKKIAVRKSLKFVLIITLLVFLFYTIYLLRFDILYYLQNFIS